MDPQNNIPTGKCFPKINKKAIRTNSMDVAQVSLLLTLNRY